jgi:hypothetical protein
MEDASYLSSGELERARRSYYLHSILNGISFRLLAGSIITLYALRLGAGNTFVGLLSSFMYFSMVFLLVGRPLVARLGAVRVQATFWALRYIAMTPALLTVIPSVRANVPLTFSLLALAVFGFHTSKGIALAGQNTILGLVVGQKDRGAVLSRVQSMNTTFSIIAWLLVGVALGREGPLGVYAAIFAVGILFGLGSSWVLSHLPEPRDAEAGSAERLLTSLRRGLENEGFRRLTVVKFLKNLFLGMTGAFLIVQFKRVFLHPDSDVVYITLIGSLGVIAMAAVAGFLMDKVGAKPLFFTFSVMTALTLLPIVAGPVANRGFLPWLIPCIVFFFYNMGSMGMNNCSQDYFFATVRPEERLNLGVVFNITAGIAGFLGSVGGGVILDLMLSGSRLSEAAVFRIYFAIMFAALLVVSLFIFRMPDIGAYSILNTLSILFSPRNLRAIRLLRRLDRSRTVHEEQQTIRALAVSPSSVSVDDLLAKLKSPSFAIRSEALNALRNHPVDPRIREALVDEVRDHQFTTAYVAAEIAGGQGIAEAIPALREALGSDDFMVSGKAMISLAQLGDRESLPVIKKLFEDTTNPRLIIHGARAFAQFRDPDLIASLVAKLEPQIAPFVRDEIILAIAEIAGMGDWFFPLYSKFLERKLAGTVELRAQLAGAAPELGVLAQEVAGEPAVFAVTVKRVLHASPLFINGRNFTETFAAALRKENLLNLSRFRFLVASLYVWQSLPAPMGPGQPGP